MDAGKRKALDAPPQDHEVIKATTVSSTLKLITRLFSRRSKHLTTNKNMNTTTQTHVEYGEGSGVSKFMELYDNIVDRSYRYESDIAEAKRHAKADIQKMIKLGLIQPAEAVAAAQVKERPFAKRNNYTNAANVIPLMKKFLALTKEGHSEQRAAQIVGIKRGSLAHYKRKLGING
jgi:hypothetical protein